MSKPNGIFADTKPTFAPVDLPFLPPPDSDGQRDHIVADRVKNPESPENKGEAADIGISTPLRCRQCEKLFTPRGPGRKQVFCSPECRRAYHDRPEGVEGPAVKRANVPTFESEIQEGGTQNGSANAPPPSKPLEEDERAGEAAFDWGSDDSVVLQDQRALAIYKNANKDIVIRAERAWDEDDDVYIVVAIDSLERVINKLEALR